MPLSSTRNSRSDTAASLPESLWRYRHWLGLLLLANLLDIVTTILGLAFGIPEGNPVEASILASFGEVWMFLFKIALVTALVLAVHPLHLRFRRLWPFLLAMTLPTALVVANNLALIAQVIV